MSLSLAGLLTKHPSGKRFEHTHEGYKAVVIVGHDVTCYGDDFIVGGIEKVEGAELARSCALALKTVNDTMIKLTGGKKRVKYCVFHFLGDKAFLERVSVERPKHAPEYLRAYSLKLANYFKGLGAYGVVTRSSFMKACLEKGDMVVHELVHVVNHSLHGDWDEDHNLWTDPLKFCSGKNLNRHCLDAWAVENNK